MEKITIELDWTPNTNHTGFFTAMAMGFYKDAGLEVGILTPDSDDYTVTPAKKVELGQADFALCPFESVISYRTKKDPFIGVAIAALLREDLSAIACLASSGITSPKDLDGKTYASYNARYEDEIVRQMIRNDGGKGDLNIVYPKKLGIWDTIRDGTYDATWIFTNWEGIQAKNRGMPIKTFRMKDYGIPYGYSPIIFAGTENVKKRKQAYASFLKATKKGFLYAKSHPEKAVLHLAPHIPENDGDIDLMESQRYTAQFYGNEETWGVMEQRQVAEYLHWLQEKGLEDYPVSSEPLMDGKLIYPES